MIGYALAGAVQGLGTGIVEEAKAKREAALKALERQQQLDDVASQRDFVRSERLATQEFQSGEAQRKAQMDAEKEKTKAAAEAARPLTDPAERIKWGIPEDDKRPYSITGMEAPKLVGSNAGTTVNVGGTEKGFDKVVGEEYGKRFMQTRDDAQAAQRTLTALDVMERAMDDPNFYSGAGSQAITQAKRLAVALGMDADGIDSMETFNAMAKQAALDSMGGSLGTGFSNADRDFVLDQVPNLQNTKEGNRQLIEIQRRIARRKLEVANLARQYAERNNGRIDAGFDGELAQWVEQNTLFPRSDRSAGGVPQVGAVEDGFRFKGGNPADPNAWEKVR